MGKLGGINRPFSLPTATSLTLPLEWSYFHIQKTVLCLSPLKWNIHSRNSPISRPPSHCGANPVTVQKHTATRMVGQQLAHGCSTVVPFGTSVNLSVDTLPLCHFDGPAHVRNKLVMTETLVPAGNRTGAQKALMQSAQHIAGMCLQHGNA
jgi:hypothetical protein